jgi:hypothetical protein
MIDRKLLNYYKALMIAAQAFQSELEAKLDRLDVAARDT